MRSLCPKSLVFALLAAFVVAFGAAPVGAANGAARMQTPRRAAEKRDALETFREKHNAVMALVRKRVKASILQTEVDKLLDYKSLSQAALGGKKRYEKNCAPRCDEFEALLTRLIRENYLRLIRKGEKHPIRYIDQVRGRRGVFKVRTEIRVNRNGRERVHEIAYVMHRVDNLWRVRDIRTDGMSLIKNYKYELNKVRKEEGINGIIARLESKLTDLAKND
ncbi:MAG: ABC transporter substrate-binding protein [Nannocystaceae bacterium]